MSHQPVQIPGVMLDDTWVLGWRVDGDRLIFDVDASLWPGHPSYASPKLGEWTCYRRGELIFEGARLIQGLKSMDWVCPLTDPDGSEDYDSFDSVVKSDDETFVVTGRFGDVQLKATSVRLAITDAT